MVSPRSNRIEAFFIATDAARGPGGVFTQNAFATQLAVEGLPEMQRFACVIVLDGRTAVPEHVTFEMFDPDGNDVPLQIEFDPGASGDSERRRVYCCHYMIFELTKPGEHRLFARLDEDIVETAMYDFVVIPDA